MPPSDPNGGAADGAPADPARARPVLVCFSHLRWAFVFQRPQHLLTRAAKEFRVYFVEEPLYQKVDAPRLDRSEGEGGVTVAVPILPEGTSAAEAEDIQRRLVDDLLAGIGGDQVVFWYYTPMAMGFSEHHRPDLTIYDCMDELAAFKFAPPELKTRERQLLDRSALVFTGGRSLYEGKRDRHHSVHLFPSSIDKAHFARARASGVADPQDQAAIPHPRLGYFGVIDERMDLALVGEMARLRPDWQFVMLGPVVKIDPASLPKLQNIHWLGSKPYPQLPDYLAGWDVGLMPFALNESTRFISPTKTPEFLAAGVPVVSTAVLDVVRSYGDVGLVEIAASAPEMVAKAERLMERKREPWLREVDRALADQSWDNTWSAMHELIERELRGSAGFAANTAQRASEAAHV